MRRREIFVRNGPRLKPDGTFEFFSRLCDALGIGRFGCLDQPLILFFREFRVDGQPDRCGFVSPARQTDGEFDDGAGTGYRFHVAGILPRCHELFQEHFQLDFTPCPPRFHIGQYPFQIAHAHRQPVHLAQSLMDFFKAFGDEPERFAQTLFQCGMQFFIDGLAHFFQFFRIVRLQVADFFFQHGAYFAHALRVRFRQRRQGLLQGVGKAFDGFGLFLPCGAGLSGIVCRQARELFGKRPHLLVLQGGNLGHLLGQTMLEAGKRTGQFLSCPLCTELDLFPHLPFGAFGGIANGVFRLLSQDFGSFACLPWPRPEKENQQQNDRKRTENEREIGKHSVCEKMAG